MYQPKGLGAIILAAIGIPAHDPEQETRTKALEVGFASFREALSGEVAELRRHVDADEGASDELKAKVAMLETSVEAMGTDLDGVATALVRAAPVVQPAPGNEESPELEPQTPAETGGAPATAGDDTAQAGAGGDDTQQREG